MKRPGNAMLPGLGNLLGCTAATERNLLVPLGLDGIGQLVGHLRNDEAGSDRIGTHATRTQLEGDRLGQTDHTGFRGRVVGLAGIAVYAHDGGHVDDAAAALTHHDRRHGMDEVVGRLEIDVDHHIPLFLIHLEHQAVAGDAGIVHQHIDAAEILHDLVNHLMGLLEVGGIGSVGLAAHAQSKYFVLRILGIVVDGQIRKSDVGAVLCEAKGDRTADTARSSRHHSDFSFK